MRLIQNRDGASVESEPNSPVLFWVICAPATKHRDAKAFADWNRIEAYYYQELFIQPLGVEGTGMYLETN